MAQMKRIYKCNVCGNIVHVLHAGAGILVCCGQDMEMLNAKSIDEGSEKHVPIIEKTSQGYKVSVGQIPHPMEDDHYIEWIEFVTNNHSYFHFLKPGEEPFAEFTIDATEYSVFAYCNIHGLWQSK